MEPATNSLSYNSVLNRHYSAYYANVTFNLLHWVKRLYTSLFTIFEIFFIWLLKLLALVFIDYLQKPTSEGGIFCECIGLLYICHREVEGLGALWKVHFLELQFLLLHRFHFLTPLLQSTAVLLGTEIKISNIVNNINVDQNITVWLVIWGL